MVVICAECGAKIYKCKAVGSKSSGDQMTPEDFIPLVDGVEPPKLNEPMDCPLCGELYVRPSGDGGVILKLEGGLWWPHPPIVQLTPSADRDQHK